ncbi:FecR family protein [Larkinella insperata]|uniref:FecR family protein n=1 Tax=Larkinella insperata TaxID=332158 RepID=A0ABW3QCA8_9BACT
MNSYVDFRVKDWVEDGPFRRWVYHGEKEEFWNRFRQQHAGQLAEMDQAREILLAVRGQLDELSETEIKSLVGEVLSVLPGKAPVRPLPWWRSHWLKGAAVLLLVLGVAFSVVRQPGGVNKLQTILADVTDFSGLKPIEVVNTTRDIQLVNLPDGSSVLLKRNARISYPATFGPGRREVSLRGEAFFEVVKDPAQPFLVYSGTMVSKVKGTSFSIRANDGDREVELVVKTGLVEVYAQESDENASDSAPRKILLKPNQQVTFNRESLRMITKTVQRPTLLNIPAEVQKFEFKRTSLSEVFAALEKTYGVDIQVDPDVIARCTLTARLGDEPIREKLDMICAVVNARYETRGRVVVVTAQGCE